jgi:hypothetical protein
VHLSQTQLIGAEVVIHVVVDDLCVVTKVEIIALVDEIIIDDVVTPLNESEVLVL